MYTTCLLYLCHSYGQYQAVHTYNYLSRSQDLSNSDAKAPPPSLSLRLPNIHKNFNENKRNILILFNGMDSRSDEEIIKKRDLVKQIINNGQVPDARQKINKKNNLSSTWPHFHKL